MPFCCRVLPWQGWVVSSSGSPGRSTWPGPQWDSGQVLRGSAVTFSTGLTLGWLGLPGSGPRAGDLTWGGILSKPGPREAPDCLPASSCLSLEFSPAPGPFLVLPSAWPSPCISSRAAALSLPQRGPRLLEPSHIPHPVCFQSSADASSFLLVFLGFACVSFRTPTDGQGQGSLACYSPWVAKSQT